VNVSKEGTSCLTTLGSRWGRDAFAELEKVSTSSSEVISEEKTSCGVVIRGISSRERKNVSKRRLLRKGGI